MFVIKRDGSRQKVRFDKIQSRIERLATGLWDGLDIAKITQKVIQGLENNMRTSDLDESATDITASFGTRHPDYTILAGRIAVSNLHKNTSGSFCETVQKLHAHVHASTGKHMPLVSDELLDVVTALRVEIEAKMDYNLDYKYDIFGFRTLQRSYLIRMHGEIVERPQHMIMRVALGIHGADIPAALETYELMSQNFFTHATPTLFNAGTPHPQMSSCFLLTMKDDSIDGIYDTLKECAVISKYAGGIGLSIHNIRASGSFIAGTNGSSNGIVPMLNVFGATAQYVDQGGGKRKGSFAIYMEPWHRDIEAFLELRLNTTSGSGEDMEAKRNRTLFYGLWTPDLFMRRVKANASWSLFCPKDAPGLADTYGEDFDALYAKYEANPDVPRKTVQAQALWKKIVTSQVETGTPYMLYKDACNQKSNQKNLGTIRSSNLCTEIVEYTSPEETAVCNLASIALPKFVQEDLAGDPYFSFPMLERVTRVVARNLNKVIDRSFYPVETARRSNLRHRPMGIGVQGLADAFAMMRYPFDSEQARQLNKDIFETIYYAAVSASVDLAEKFGPYASFAGSPASEGKFQFDLWGKTPSDRYDWEALRARMVEHGLRNSLLTAPMPTASTAQILGNNESVEPFTSNMYARSVLSGEYIVVNRYMMQDLIARNLWTPAVREKLLKNRGSIQGIDDIPADIQALHKIVWDMPKKVILDMAIDRAPYICQSQSMNVYMTAPTMSKVTAMHFYGWRNGLKTGMYYLRTRPKADAVQFTIQSRLRTGSRQDVSGQGASSTEPDEHKTAEVVPSLPAPLSRSAVIRNVSYLSVRSEASADDRTDAVDDLIRAHADRQTDDGCDMCGA